MSKEKEVYWKKFFANIEKLKPSEVVDKVRAGNIEDPEFMRKYATEKDFHKVRDRCLFVASQNKSSVLILSCAAYITLCTDETMILKQAVVTQDSDTNRKVEVAFLKPKMKKLDALLEEVVKERINKAY